MHLIMDNPYVSGAITAAVYLLTSHFLPKKIKGAMRVGVAIMLTVVISLLIQYVISLCI